MNTLLAGGFGTYAFVKLLDLACVQPGRGERGAEAIRLAAGVVVAALFARVAYLDACEPADRRRWIFSGPISGPP